MRIPGTHHRPACFGVLLLLAVHSSSCDPPTGPPEVGPRVDVKFRAGVVLDEPLQLLPRRLRTPIKRISPLVTLSKEELDRIGAERMARWFRLELAPGTDIGRFMAELRALETVEVVEQAPEPAPDPIPPG